MGFFNFFKTPEQIKSLKAADFKTAIADKDVQLIDVRTAQEFNQGTIGNATLIDVYSRDFEQEVEKLDKTRPVAVFCHSGARSLHAAKVLAHKGFSVIYDLQGGIVTWR